MQEKRVAGFDDLIRGALEKQGNPDAERRSTIYNSSRQALERMLSQNTTMDAATVALQRDRLETSIATIENDYLAREAASAAPTVAPAPPATGRSTPAPAVTSTPPRPQMADNEVRSPVAAPAPTAKPAAQRPTAQSPAPAARVEPRIEPSVAPQSAGVDVQPTRLEDFTGEVPDRERKPYAKLLLWTIILVGLAIAVWWAITFGPALLRQKLDGRIPNSSQTIQSGTFVPGEEDGWRKVFVPSENGENIDSAGRGTADIFVEGESSFVRMASAAGASRNTIRIKLPRGILFAIRGKAATFEFIMKGRGTEPHQFAVFCEFGAMGECGRKRFKITDKAEAFIFDVLVNDIVLSAGNEAYLTINTDLSSGGKAVDLYSIRVRTEE